MNAPGANIRRAASLLLPRDGPRGVEWLLMRRPEHGNDFRSGACVFPGGVLDAADAQCHRWCFGLDDAVASRRLGLGEGGLDYFIAALRECFEEVGLLHVCARDGSVADVTAHADALHDWRSRLHRGQASLAGLCEAFDWRLDLRDMAYVSYWLTPVTRPKRFDTRFFVKRLPAQQQATPDLGEALELLWLTPDEALDPQRGLKLLNVTQQTLRSMRGFASAEAALRHAIELRGVTRVLPRPAIGRDGPRFVVNREAAYAEVAHLDPDGHGGVRCVQDPGDVVRLSPRLVRICGARRHAHAVSDSHGTAWAVLDADAADAPQLAALQATVHAAVQYLLCSDGSASDPRLQGLWPAAAVIDAAQSPPGRQLALGSDCHLARTAEGWLLGEERTLLCGAAPAAGARRPGVEWLAPSSGFLQRCDD